ncbi:DUF2860 domain-containing protein [Candidatus Pelagibacter sp.]|nr:DUF2860 domain-containing protein [Candidatus Pelagibacter sp.]
MSLRLIRLIFFSVLSIFFCKPVIAEVSFFDIIENPDDLKINLEYAKQQEALGRYKATLATLERLNMLYPVNTDIKLYLISILLKMDSIAKLELMLEIMLQDPNTTKETRDYIEGVLKTIEDQSKPKPKWFAYLDLYYKQTDHSNIDGASKSGFAFFVDGVEPIPGPVYDKTFSRGGSITIGKNIDSTSAISFNAGLSVNNQDKGRENESDIGSGSVSYSKVIGKHFLIPYAYYSRPNQNWFDDSKSIGIGFNNSYGINQNNSINYSASFSNTKYNKKLNNRVTDPSLGNSEIHSGSIGYNYSFFGKNLISSKFSYTAKHAKEDYNGYEGTGFNIGYTRILPFGNLKLDKTFQTNHYEEKNVALHSTITRIDDIETSKIQLSGRITQLFPFIKKLDPGGKFFYNLNFTEIDSSSTILQNAAIRQNASFNITKRFSLYE